MKLGILLAGGRSERFGREKPLLELDGETLVARHARQLRATGVDDLLVIVRPENRRAITKALRGAARLLEQVGEGMSAAVATGLDAVRAQDVAWVVCVNDIILDTAYRAIDERAHEISGLVIPSVILKDVFVGGQLIIGEGTDRILGIREKPRGGCQPGSAVNVMVHRFSSAPLVREVRKQLAAGTEYEDGLTLAIADGHAVVVQWLNEWIAVKTPRDYEIARERIGTTSGASQRPITRHP